MLIQLVSAKLKLDKNGRLKLDNKSNNEIELFLFFLEAVINRW